MKKYLLLIFIFTCIILGKDFFLLKGTYFLLDTVFYPITNLHLNFRDEGINRIFKDILVYLFGYIYISKLFYFVLIFSSGFLGFLFGDLISNKILASEDKFLKSLLIFSGICFFMFNPFLYERIITQIGVYEGILFIGYGIYFLFQMILGEYKNWKLIFIFFALSGTVMLQSIIMIALILGLYLLIFSTNFLNIKQFFIGILIILILNLNWIMGMIFLPSENKREITFNNQNIEVFKSNGLDNLPPEITSLLGYGFWGEKYFYLIFPNFVNNKWFISGFLIIIISFIGLGYLIYFRKTRKIGIFLLLLGIISYILAIGISGNLFTGLNWLLFKYLPFYSGFREPHKWLGIYTIVIGIGFIIGIYQIYLLYKYRLKNYFELGYIFGNQYLWLILTFLLIYSWSPNLLFGFNGQLFMTNYPASYFKSKDFLLQNITIKQDKILLLPWHSYLACGWTRGRIVANIYDRFYKPLNVIIADNIEIGNLYTNSNVPQSKDIEKFISNKKLELLIKNNFKYIINLKSCADFPYYSFLNKLQGLNKIYNTDEIEVFEIN